MRLLHLECIARRVMIFTCLFFPKWLFAAPLESEQVKRAIGEPQLSLVALLVHPARLTSQLQVPPMRVASRRPIGGVRMMDGATMSLEDARRLLMVYPDDLYEEILEKAKALGREYGEDKKRSAVIIQALNTIVTDYFSGELLPSNITIQPPEERSRKLAVNQNAPKKVETKASRKEVFERPSRKFAIQVLLTLGGLGLAPWLAPGIAPMAMLINAASAAGFMYNRGEREVARDDSGNVGEVRPISPKAMIFCALITALLSVCGFFQAQRIISARPNLPTELGTVVMNSVIASFLIWPALFIKTQWLRRDD